MESLKAVIFSFHFCLSMKLMYVSLFLSKGILNECACLLWSQSYKRTSYLEVLETKPVLAGTTFGAVQVWEIATLQKAHTFFFLYAHIYANKMKTWSLKRMQKALEYSARFAGRPQLRSYFALPFFHAAKSHQYVIRRIKCYVRWLSRDDVPQASHLLQTTLNSAQLLPTLLFLLRSKEACRHALQQLSLPGKSYFPELLRGSLHDQFQRIGIMLCVVSPFRIHV